MRLLAAIALAAALPLAGCGGSETADTSEEPPSGGETATQQADRCRDVPQARIDAIASGLDKSAGVSAGNAAAVRSRDYEKMWMVAIELNGPGLDGEKGVWTTNRLEEQGLVFAVDGIAKEFSDWGDGGPFSVVDDGVAEAKHCLDG